MQGDKRIVNTSQRLRQNPALRNWQASGHYALNPAQIGIYVTVCHDFLEFALLKGGLQEVEILGMVNLGFTGFVPSEGL